MLERVAVGSLEVELWRNIHDVNVQIGSNFSDVDGVDAEDFHRAVLRYDAVVDEACLRLGIVAPKDYKQFPDSRHFHDWYAEMEQVQNPQGLAE